MLPHIEGEERRLAMDQRGIGIGGGADLQLAVGQREPSPATAELTDRGLLEILGKSGETAEILLDRLSQRPAGLAALGRHRIPQEGVIPGLGGIVEERGLILLARRRPHDLLQALVREIGIGDQLIGLVHIGLVVFAMVEFQGGFADMRLERIQRIGKLRQFDGHL